MSGDDCISKPSNLGGIGDSSVYGTLILMRILVSLSRATRQYIFIASALIVDLYGRLKN